MHVSHSFCLEGLASGQGRDRNLLVCSVCKNNIHIVILLTTTTDKGMNLMKEAQ